MVNSSQTEKLEAFKLRRTKRLALRVIRLFQALPKSEEARIIGKQLLRSATSVAANYRAACRGRSEAERYSKMCIVVEEADETLFWLEMLHEAEIIALPKIQGLLNEYLEVVKITSTTRQKLTPKR